MHRARATAIKSQHANRYGHGFPPDPLSKICAKALVPQLQHALRKLRAAFRQTRCKTKFAKTNPANNPSNNPLKNHPQNIQNCMKNRLTLPTILQKTHTQIPAQHLCTIPLHNPRVVRTRNFVSIKHNSKHVHSCEQLLHLSGYIGLFKLLHALNN